MPNTIDLNFEVDDSDQSSDSPSRNNAPIVNDYDRISSRRALEFWREAIKNQISISRILIDDEQENKIAPLDGMARSRFVHSRLNCIKEQLRGGYRGLFWWDDQSVTEKLDPIYPVECYIAHTKESRGWCIGILTTLPESVASAKGLLTECVTMSGTETDEPRVYCIEDSDQILSLSVSDLNIWGDKPYFEGQIIMVKGIYSSLNRYIKVSKMSFPPHPGIADLNNHIVKVDGPKARGREEIRAATFLNNLMTHDIPLDCIVSHVEIASHAGVKALSALLKKCDISCSALLQEPTWNPPEGARCLPPAVIVLLGPFVPFDLITSAKTAKEQLSLLNTAMTTLTQILGEFPNILASSHIVLVPGYPSCGLPDMFPSWEIPNFMIQKMTTALSHIVGFQVSNIHAYQNPTRLTIANRSLLLSVVEHGSGIRTTLPGSRSHYAQGLETDMSTYVPEAMLCQNSLIPEASLTRPHPGMMNVCWSQRSWFLLAESEYPLQTLPDLTIVSDCSRNVSRSYKKSWKYMTRICMASTKSPKLIVNPGNLCEGEYFEWNAVSGEGSIRRLTSNGDEEL